MSDNLPPGEICSDAIRQFVSHCKEQLTDRTKGKSFSRLFYFIGISTILSLGEFFEMVYSSSGYAPLIG